MSLIPVAAVKKSKQFEIQKVVRRLKQTSNDTPSQDATEVSKLESVLTSLRAADIDRLANLAASSVGISPDDTTAADTVPAVDRIEPVDRRILSAKCVVEQLDIMVAALKAIQNKAELQLRKQQLAQEAEEENKGDDDAIENIKRLKKKARLTAGSESDPSEEEDKLGESSEEESDVEPDDDALQAIEKLLASKKAPRKIQAGGGSDDDMDDSSSGGEGDDLPPQEDSESEDDSGVIDNISEQEEDLMNTDDDSEDEKGNNYKKKNGGIGSERHPQQPVKKVKSKPKKSKNRLGQRARRQLGEQQQMQGRNSSAPYRQGVQQNFNKREPRRGSFRDHNDGGRGGGGGDREGTKYPINRRKQSIGKVEDEGPLHPSWAARRQQKEKMSIVKDATVAPSNKKTVFDDDGSKKIITKPSSSFAPRRPIAASTKNVPANDEGPLHPSWELKKKMANAQKHMQPAQGKKIVFND